MSGSIFLDVLRFGAACTVMLSHFRNVVAFSGFPDLTAAGHLAVSVFFVLSGFVIRYVTTSRESSAKRYFIDRASRIYSVVIPALLITITCEWLASIPIFWRQVPVEIGANLIFQAQDWGYEINPLHNDAFWSLSFECIYYAVYGLVFYRVRGGWMISILLLLLAGPSVVLLFPVWLLGCFTFDMYQRLRGSFYAPALIAAALFGLAAANAPILRVARLTDESHRATWIAHFFGPVPWLSRASSSFVIVGVAAAGLILFSLLLLDRVEVKESAIVRRLADSTFALYLLHIPFIILAVTVLGGKITTLLRAVVIAGSIILACIAISKPLDALKRYLRVRLENI